MTLDEIEVLREGWDFEAKLATGRDGNGELPDALWDTYSAFANTAGGYILLGAKELKDGSLELRGIPNVDKVERLLWNLLQNPQKVSANVLRKEDVTLLNFGGDSLLLIYVRKAYRSEQPIFINGSLDKGTYIRVHEGDRRLAPDKAQRLIAERHHDRDAKPLEEFTFDDLSLESIRRYREFFAAQRPEHIYLDAPSEQFLITIGAMRTPRGQSTAYPTLAGLLMLGEERSIRELLPHWHLSYKELPDEPHSSVRWLDRVHPDGTWNANLFEFYLRVIRKLYDGLKAPFQLKHGHVRDDDTPVHQALREALVNMIVHADYHGTTGLKVIKGRAGFEFVNPGTLLISPEQLWVGGISEPRNPVLQRLFGLLQLGEREGSGGPAMRKAWSSQHWRNPQIFIDVEHLETHLKLPLESLLPDDVVSDLVRRLGTQFTAQDELGRVILVLAELEGQLSHSFIKELSDAHPRDITLKLQELVRAQLLCTEGRTRSMVYMPTRMGGQVDGKSPQYLTKLTAASPDNADTSPDSADTSPDNADTSPDSADTSPDNADTALALFLSTQRASKALVERAILELCSGRFLTSQELATSLMRSPHSVKTRYLPPLVQDGRLEMLYPEIPNHPQQAYRTKVV